MPSQYFGSSDGYGHAGLRGDCGHVLPGVTVAYCPGEVACSAHGVCHDATDDNDPTRYLSCEVGVMSCHVMSCHVRSCHV